MTITGKIRLFINEAKTKEGQSFNYYTTSIIGKNTKGDYLHQSLNVKFSKESFPVEKLAKLDKNCYYDVDIAEAFLTLEEVKGQNRLCLMIKNAKCTAKHPLKPQEVKEIDFLG